MHMKMRGSNFIHVPGVGLKARFITGLLPFEVNGLVDTCEGMNAFKAFSYFRWMQIDIIIFN